MESFDYKIKEKISAFEYHENPEALDMTDLFERMEAGLPSVASKSVEDTKGKVIRIPAAFYRIAASLLILGSLLYAFYWMNGVSVVAPNGQHLTHTLPDGSLIELNAGSSIKYNDLAWKFKRNITFEGEAFFKVNKGSAFTVFSSKGTTQVLGTSFNIFSRGNKYVVECFTGRVQVSYQGAEDDIFLTPGEGIAYKGIGIGTQLNIDTDDQKGWRKGEFYFDNDPLENVAEELSRQFNIDVELENNIGQMRYSGYFNNKSLEKALKMVCDPLDIKYSIRKDRVEIKKK